LCCITGRRSDLDLAGRQLAVDRVVASPLDLAAHGDHPLGAQLVRARMRLGRHLGAKHHLDQTLAVAQVDEDQAAVIAAAMHPARDHDLLVDRSRGHGAARVRSAQTGHAVELDAHGSRSDPCPSRGGRKTE
jgi:hypothetical protein